ncbi:MAG TPA: flagellar hook-basal body complex protein FliE [Rhodocyclaceae bacterium]|nr:flagellar hook-basal body complex protein FliE [Rhodocyclaceae bacterium]
MNVLPVGISMPDIVGTQPMAAGVVNGGTAASSGTDFSSMFDNAVSGLNSDLMTAQTGLQGLASGDAKSIHEVMIGMENAKLQFELIMQVRNRVIDAYQDLMRTQV